MVFENLEVVHKSFGEGTVVSTNGKYITVRFASGNKTFVYPDMFERFLTLKDGTVSDEIKEDILKSNSQKQAILAQKREENVRAMTKGIVIPGKESQSLDSEDEDNRTRTSDSEE